MLEQSESSKKMAVTEAWSVIKGTWPSEEIEEKDILRLKEAYRTIIASRVKTVRAAAGMTQEEVSKKISTNPFTYRGYENCKSDIPIVYLIRIADLFNVSMDYLTGRTDDNGKPNHDLEERISRLEKELKINRDSPN